MMGIVSTSFLSSGGVGSVTTEAILLISTRNFVISAEFILNQELAVERGRFEA
jgi:hypothetical protein